MGVDRARRRAVELRARAPARASRRVPGLQRVQQRDRRPDRDAPRALRSSSSRARSRSRARAAACRSGSLRLRPRWPSPRSASAASWPRRRSARARCAVAHAQAPRVLTGQLGTVDTMNLRTSSALQRMNAFQQMRLTNARRVAQRRPGRLRSVTLGRSGILFDSVPFARHLVRLKPRSRRPGGGADRGRKVVPAGGSGGAALR